MERACHKFSVRVADFKAARQAFEADHTVRFLNDLREWRIVGLHWPQDEWFRVIAYATNPGEFPSSGALLRGGSCIYSEYALGPDIIGEPSPGNFANTPGAEATLRTHGRGGKAVEPDEPDADSPIILPKNCAK